MRSTQVLGQACWLMSFLTFCLCALPSQTASTSSNVDASELNLARSKRSIVNQCHVNFRHNREHHTRRAHLEMHFLTPANDTMTRVELCSYGNRHKRAQVKGGPLELIQVHPRGEEVCLQSLTIWCEDNLIPGRKTNRVKIDVSAIRSAWTRQGTSRYLDVNWAKNCMGIKKEGERTIHAIAVRPSVFTECQHGDQDCISKRIEIF